MAKKQWKFNARYTLCLTGLVLALGVLLYFWHAAAVRRNATAMLSRADYFRAQGDRKSEAKCLRSFLSLNPLDDAALTRFAEAMDAFGDTFTDKANAARALALALAQPGNAQRKDLQQRHIRLLWELNRLREAIDHCDAILTGTDGQKQETTDPLCREAMVVTALASFDLAAQSSQRGNWYGIVRLLNDAIAVEPSVNDQRELTNRLAAVYGDPSVTVALPAADGSTEMPISEAERSAHVESVFNDLIAKFPDSGEAYLARYRYRQGRGIAGADLDLERALELAKDDSVEVWLGAGDHFLKKQPSTTELLDKAESAFKRALAADPKNRTAQIGLANSYRSMAELNRAPEYWDKAIIQIESALKRNGNRDLELNMTLTRLLCDASRLDQASLALEATRKTLSELSLDMPASYRARAAADVERLRGRIQAGKGDYIAAIATLLKTVELERTVPADAMSTAEVENSPFNTQLLLARCYETNGNPEQAAKAYEEALSSKPYAIQVRLAAARAWEAAGRGDRAAAQSAKVLEDPRAEKLMPLATAQLAARLLARTDVTSEQLVHVHRLIKNAESAGANAAEVCLLRVGLAVAENNMKAAADALAAAELVPNLSVSQLRSLSLAYESLARPDDADRIWKQIEASGDTLASSLLRSDLLRRRSMQAEAEDYLAAALNRFNAADQETARLELSQIAIDRGRTNAARDYLQPLIESTRPSLRATRQFAMLSVNLNDWIGTEKAESLLQNLEPAEISIPTAEDGKQVERGAHWCLFRALRLASLAEGANDARLSEAETLLKSLASQRPNWNMALQLEALIAEKRGDYASAVAAYRRLIESEPDLNLRSFATGRYLALAASLPSIETGDSTSLPSAVATSPTLSLQALAREVARGDMEAAIRRAEDAVQQRPNDAMAQIWLAQTLRMAKRPVNAVAAFRKAIQLSPRNPVTWTALLEFYEDARDIDAIQSLHDEFQINGKLDEPQRTLFLARIATATSNSESLRQAGQAYDALLVQFPDDPDVLQQTVRYWSIHNSRRALQILRDLNANHPNNMALRRQLVRVLATQGDSENLKESLQLLCGKNGNIPREDDDKRLYVEILARQDNPAARRQAIDIMQELRQGRPSLPYRDILLLASLLELDGQYPAALACLAELAGRQAPAAEHVAIFADFLLRHTDAASAQFVSLADGAVKELESVQPLELRTLALRVRTLIAAGESREVDAVLASFANRCIAMADKPSARAEIQRSIGALCEELQLLQQAEDFYRGAASTDTSLRAALARFLANRRTAQAVNESITLVEDILAANPNDVIAIMALCIAVGESDEATAIAKEPLLGKVLEANAENVAVLQAFAGLRLEQERFSDAVDLLRKAVQLDPVDGVAVNNLAYLLAVTGDIKESETLIRRILASHGPVSSYRDTYGLILLLSGRNAEALELFTDLARSEPSAPILGHLAVAHHRAGQLDEATRTFGDAVRAGLQVQRLPKCEQELIAELTK